MTIVFTGVILLLKSCIIEFKGSELMNFVVRYLTSLVSGFPEEVPEVPLKPFKLSPKLRTE